MKRQKVCGRCKGERYVEKPEGRVYVPCPRCNDIYGKHLRKVVER